MYYIIIFPMYWGSVALLGMCSRSYKFNKKSYGYFSMDSTMTDKSGIKKNHIYLCVQTMTRDLCKHWRTKVR